MVVNQTEPADLIEGLERRAPAPGRAGAESRSHEPAARAPRLRRSPHNPIISPRPGIAWESFATFNTAAIRLDGRVHLLYRAMGELGISVLGCASSVDGVHLDERLDEPAYVPREPFEITPAPPRGHAHPNPYARQYMSGGGCGGCEDPRLTRIDDTLYMTYVAFDGFDPPRVALTPISVDEFLARRWERWERPIAVSAPEIWDKDACLFPRKVGGRFVVIHRLSVGIWIDFVADLRDLERQWLGGKVLLAPRPDRWDNRKVGACGPPIETEAGWLFLYHGITEPGSVYSVGAALLGLDDPGWVLARTDEPIFTPEADYESRGVVNNVVFPCGTVVKGQTLYVYYGGADRVVGVAVADLGRLVSHVRAASGEGDR